MLNFGDIFVNMNEKPNYFGDHEGRHTYRLNHFYKKDPYQDARKNNFKRLHPVVASLFDDEPDRRDTQVRLVMCSRRDAEYVSGSGVSGCLVKIEDIEVVGTVKGRWTRDFYGKMRRNATTRLLWQNAEYPSIHNIWVNKKTGRIAR